jgi:ubiquinone/menaquinone biosynthesis C-methylase UbiE
MKQKEIFLAGEGNAWFTRNADALTNHRLPDSDPLLVELLGLKQQFAPIQGGGRVLEVGCGSGTRLDWLQRNMGLECHGIDPSDMAVSQAVSSGVLAQVGTADQLPFADNSFDVVIFGFCLYLCDRDDLFKIAAEADRVLKNQGWLLIKDFYSPTPLAKSYHHKAGVYSYKMDYSSLFTWNPYYNVFSTRVTHHATGGYTDDRQEWVATSVLRKCRQS